MNILKQQLSASPIIAAIDSEKRAQLAIKSDAKIIFVLGCDICYLQRIVTLLKRNDKIVFVHVDLVNGLGKDTYAVDYLKKVIQPNGIISTRHSLIKQAKSQGMMAVQRMFLLDSSSVKSGIEMATKSNADFIELMPGVIPRAIRSIKRHITQPIIAGGMIDDIDTAYLAIEAGAVGVSTSCEKLWYNSTDK